jgi:hypothetical protein
VLVVIEHLFDSSDRAQVYDLAVGYVKHVVTSITSVPKHKPFQKASLAL